MTLLKFGKLEQNPAKLNETLTVKVAGNKKPSTKLTEGLEPSEYLMPRIEAIHAGRTRNYNHYLADKLKGDASIGSGVYSWLAPYPKPVIYNHDTDTDATGRIMSAAYADYTQAGRPGIIVIPKITETKAVQALKDGRLMTVSIGATSDAAICSICGTDIVNEGYCGHMKGEEYNGQVAEWIAGNIWFDELSWVNVPADSDAMVVDTQSSIFLDVPTDGRMEDTQTTESAPSTRNSYFGVPKHTNLIVVESKGFKNVPAEINKQEENHEMEDELEQAQTTVETTEPAAEPATPVAEPEAQTVVDPAEPDAAEPVNSDVPSKGDTPEEPAVSDEEDETKPAVPAEEPNSNEAEKETDAELVAENIQLKANAVGLQAQVESLTKEIKAIYVERIVEQSTIAEDKKAGLIEKLSNRSIDSLKDRLEDLSEGLITAPVVETAVEEEKPARIVTQVKSPVVATEDAKPKEVTEKTAVDFFTSLMSQTRK